MTGMGRPEGEPSVGPEGGDPLGVGTVSGLWRTAEWSGHVQGAPAQRWPCPGARLGRRGPQQDQSRLGKPTVGGHLTCTQNIFQI